MPAEVIGDTLLGFFPTSLWIPGMDIFSKGNPRTVGPVLKVKCVCVGAKSVFEGRSPREPGKTGQIHEDAPKPYDRKNVFLAL